MYNGFRERVNPGRGKHGTSEQNHAEHESDDVSEASQETLHLAENVNAETPTTVAAGSTVANVASNQLGSATSHSARDPKKIRSSYQCRGEEWRSLLDVRGAAVKT